MILGVYVYRAIIKLGVKGFDSETENAWHAEVVGLPPKTTGKTIIEEDNLLQAA